MLSVAFHGPMLRVKRMYVIDISEMHLLSFRDELEKRVQAHKTNSSTTGISVKTTSSSSTGVTLDIIKFLSTEVDE